MVGVYWKGAELIEGFRVPGYCARHPFRVSINGVVQRNKKGREKEFDSILEAVSWAQRKVTKGAKEGKE